MSEVVFVQSSDKRHLAAGMGGVAPPGVEVVVSGLGGFFQCVFVAGKHGSGDERGGRAVRGDGHASTCNTPNFLEAGTGSRGDYLGQNRRRVRIRSRWEAVDVEVVGFVGVPVDQLLRGSEED